MKDPDLLTPMAILQAPPRPARLRRWRWAQAHRIRGLPSGEVNRTTSAVVFDTLARMAPEILRADMDEDGNEPDDDDGSLEKLRARRLLEPV